METLIRCRIMRRLIWVCTVYLCTPFRVFQQQWVKMFLPPLLIGIWSQRKIVCSLRSIFFFCRKDPFPKVASEQESIRAGMKIVFLVKVMEKCVLFPRLPEVLPLRFIPFYFLYSVLQNSCMSRT